MVLLRDASRGPGWREASGAAQTSDRVNGKSEGGGRPQHRAPDVLLGSGGSRQEENVYAPLQRGQCEIPLLTNPYKDVRSCESLNL